MKLSEQKVDVEKTENGDWVDSIPEMQGLRLKVRGLNNKAYRKLFERLTDAVPRNKKIGRLDPAERDRIIAQCLRDTVLLDWDGLEDDDDKPIPYSKERANEYLTDPQYERFKDAVLWAASVVGTKQAAEIEQDAGN